MCDVPSAHRGEKKGSLELELQAVESHHMGAGRKTQLGGCVCMPVQMFKGKSTLNVGSTIPQAGDPD